MLLYVVLCMYTEGKGAMSRDGIQGATRQRRGRMIKVGRRPACACGVWHAARDRVGSCWSRSACRIMWDRPPQTELPQLSAALPLRPRLHRLAANHPGLPVCLRASLVGRSADQLSLFPFPVAESFSRHPRRPRSHVGMPSSPRAPPCKLDQALHRGLAAALLRQRADVPRQPANGCLRFATGTGNGLEPRPVSRHSWAGPCRGAGHGSILSCCEVHVRRRKRHHSILYNNLHIDIYMYSSICSSQHGSMHGLPDTRSMLMPWLVPSRLEPPWPWWPSPSPTCVQQQYPRRGPPNAP